MSDDRERKKVRFKQDVGVVLGIATGRYGLTRDEALDVLTDVADEVQSGRYDIYFAAGQHRDSDEDDAGSGNKT